MLLDSSTSPFHSFPDPISHSHPRFLPLSSSPPLFLPVSPSPPLSLYPHVSLLPSLSLPQISLSSPSYAPFIFEAHKRKNLRKSGALKIFYTLLPFPPYPISLASLRRRSGIAPWHSAMRHWITSSRTASLVSSTSWMMTTPTTPR